MSIKAVQAAGIIPQIKICGITSLEEAQTVLRYGADAIGFLVGQVYCSSDFISVDVAHDIVKKLPPDSVSVLVTHLTDPQEILRLVKLTKTKRLQLHGDFNVDDIAIIRKNLPGIQISKALSVSDEKVIKEGLDWEKHVDALVLDTALKSENKIGGTGKIHDWDLSARVVKTVKIPIILAGGLTPDNVYDAIIKVRPAAVDVHTGVEGPDGNKDTALVEKFISEARRGFLNL